MRLQIENTRLEDITEITPRCFQPGNLCLESLAFIRYLHHVAIVILEANCTLLTLLKLT